MAGISFLNNENLPSSPSLSQGQEGAGMRPDPALEARVPGSSRQMVPNGVSPLTEAEGPLLGAQEGERPGLDPRDRPAFRVTISPAASRLAQGFLDGENPAHTDRAGSPGATGGPNGSAPTFAEENRPNRVRSEGEEPSRGRELSDADQRDVEELKRQDRRVRQHEQAHMAAGGRYVRGGAKYEYTMGPDGRRYATGGEVPIDLSAEKDPRATIQKMNTVRRAALAPADPSAADRAIAARASRKATAARRQLSENPKQESPEGPAETGGVGRDQNDIRKTQAEPSANRTEERIDPRDPSEGTAASAPESAANAVLRTGLLRALSRVTAPPPPIPDAIDRYA